MWWWREGRGFKVILRGSFFSVKRWYRLPFQLLVMVLNKEEEVADGEEGGCLSCLTFSVVVGVAAASRGDFFFIILAEGRRRNEYRGE